MTYMYILGKLEDIDTYIAQNAHDYERFNVPVDEYTMAANVAWLDHILADLNCQIMIVSEEITGHFQFELDYLIENYSSINDTFVFPNDEIKQAITEYYWAKVNPLGDCITVKQLIAELSKYDGNLPVLATFRGWVREGEYFSFGVYASNLSEQNVTGDPEYYGFAPCVLLRG